MMAEAKHVHKFSELKGTPVAPETPQEKAEADRIRSRKRGYADNGQFAPYDYQADDRMILTRDCECGATETIDLLRKPEARELYAKIKKNLNN